MIIAKIPNRVIFTPYTSENPSPTLSRADSAITGCLMRGRKVQKPQQVGTPKGVWAPLIMAHLHTYATGWELYLLFYNAYPEYSPMRGLPLKLLQSQPAVCCVARMGTFMLAIRL